MGAAKVKIHVWHQNEVFLFKVGREVSVEKAAYYSMSVYSKIIKV